MRRLIIDTDTGSDDAVALVMACAARDVVVEAITVVAGNVPLEQGVQNALYTLERCGARVPVYRGAAAPMRRPLQTAQEFHGQDGMGDVGLPLAGRTPAPGDAVDVLRALIRRFPGEVELVALAPLTNIAEALIAEPDLATLLKRVVIMGGAGDGIGNITPLAEYNLWVDPEAAHVVFASGAPIEMVGWDVARTYATFDRADADALRACGAMGAFFVDTQRTLVDVSLAAGRGATFNLPDPAAMAVALDPSIVTAPARAYVEIATSDGDARGQAIVDRTGASGRAANVTVIDAIARDRFVALLHAAATVVPASGS